MHVLKHHLILLSAILFSFGAIAPPVQAQIEISEEVNPAFAALEEAMGLAVEPIRSADDMQVGQEVINGIEVDDRYFPAVFGKMRRGEANPSCTSALIGPSTILIAAHCVDDNPHLRLRNDNATVRGLCVAHPNWHANSDTGSDIALCLLERRISGIVYERVSLTLPRVGQMLHFVGYGCTEQGQARDGILRLGAAPAQNRPPQMRFSSGTLYTMASVESELGILCPGDSGGPLYQMGGTLDGPRVILGVNSATTFSMGISAFAALGAAHNAAFITSFAEANNQEICGINRDLGCKLP